MRILSIHNEYRIRGGEDVSREAEERLLRKHGHQVDVYQESNNHLSEIGKAQLAIRTIWSQDSYDIVRAKLQTKKYDIVHVQNFFPLISPSVYYAAAAEGVPVVQTLRNYRLLCPNALFFRDGKVCEDCMGKLIPYPGIIHGCYRENRIASAAVTSMITSHRFAKTWDSKVDRYITLTHFSRSKMIEGGLPAHKILVKPNFVDPEPAVGNGSGNYALYVGRLSVEKGIDTLIAAWERLHTSMPLKIVGDGPLSDLVTRATEANPHIEWLGRRPIDEVHRLMGDAQFLVFPSKWYETFGRVAIEAFATGTPVIAADIGAIAEVVTDRQTGLHFTPADPASLADKVNWLISRSEARVTMRQKARQTFEENYTAQANYQQLIEIYSQVLNTTTSTQKRSAFVT